MATNDIRALKENAEATFDEVVLSASDLKLGTTSGLPVKTGTGGLLEAGAFGSASGQFCEGNDARLSDVRTPSAHTHTSADITDLNTSGIAAGLYDQTNAQTGVSVNDYTLRVQGPSGYVDLDAGSTSGTRGINFPDASGTLALTSDITKTAVGLGNVSNTAQVTSVTGTAPIVSSGGTTPAISITAATTSAAGSMSASDKSKLDGIASGATANSSDATLLARANHTGTQAASTITDLAAIATSGSASDLTSGTVPTARLGTGTASASNFLRGDGTWNAPAAPANMTGATSSTAGTAGLVPQPAAGNEELMLTGAGTFHVPNLPIVKTETTRGTTTARWILPPFAQDTGAGSTGGANFEFCGGYVYVPYTGNYYFATRPAAAYSGSTKTCWALYNLATDGLPGTLAVTLGELDVGAGSNVLCESATTVSLTKGWYCCVSRANGSFNLWSPQSHSWLNYIVGKPTAVMTSTASEGKRRFYRSLTYSTTFSSDLTSTTWTEDTNVPPCCWIRRG